MSTTLVLKKDVDNRNPAPNATVRYAILVQNTGNGASGSVTVTDVLPQGVTFVRGTMGNISNQSGTLTLTADNVRAGEFVLWLFEARLSATGRTVNTATMSYGGQNLSASIDMNVGTSSGRLGIGEEAGMSMKVKAYPNPSSGKVLVEIRLSEPSPLTLQCLDTQGRSILRQELKEESSTHQAEIDISAWGKGVYIINAQSNTQSQSKKVVRE